MLENRLFWMSQSCRGSNSALMNEAREASWRENIPVGNRSAAHETLGPVWIQIENWNCVVCLHRNCSAATSPRLSSSGCPTTASQWKLPALWPAIQSQWVQSQVLMSKHVVGWDLLSFFFFFGGKTLGSSSMNELLAQAHNPITSDLEMYVYNSWIESDHDGLRAVLALGRSSTVARHSEPKLPLPPPLHF